MIVIPMIPSTVFSNLLERPLVSMYVSKMTRKEQIISKTYSTSRLKVISPVKYSAIDETMNCFQIKSLNPF